MNTRKVLQLTLATLASNPTDGCASNKATGLRQQESQFREKNTRRAGRGGETDPKFKGKENFTSAGLQGTVPPGENFTSAGLQGTVPAGEKEKTTVDRSESKRTLCTHRALAAAAAHSPGALAKRVWENTHASEPAVPRGGRKGGGGERGSSEGLSLLLPSPTVPPFGSLPGLSVLSRAEGQIFQSNG